MVNLVRYLRSVRRRIGRRLTRASPFPEPLQSWVATAGPLTVVDIGANHGEFTAALVRSHQVRQAWLVEPQRELMEGLAGRFPPPRFSVHQLALADRAGTIELEISSGFEVTASVLPIKADLAELGHLPLGERRTEICPVNTLDGFAADAGIDRIDLMKVDVQGAELLVFQGGAKTLGRTEAVWVELSLKQLYGGACLIHEVVACLHSYGLYLRDMAPEFRGPSGELLQVNGLFTRGPMRW